MRGSHWLQITGSASLHTTGYYTPLNDTVGDGERGPLGILGIKRKLDEMKVPTYRDTRKGKIKKRAWGVWSLSTVHHILTNESYSGIFRYGKMGAANGKRIKNPQDYLIAVEVPAIVTRKKWEAVQVRLKKNLQDSPRNRGYEYLMARRLYCGKCGNKMQCSPNHSHGKCYLYYRCSGHYQVYAVKCDVTKLFPANKVDAIIWQWVESLLSDPKILERGLNAYQAKLDEVHAPIRQRLIVVEDLIADYRDQLEKLLDLYLSGNFAKEMLVDRKTRLEDSIAALEQERANMISTLEAQVLTKEQVQSLKDFAGRVMQKLDETDLDFEKKRYIIELMDVQATLVLEDGEMVAYVRSKLAEDVLQVPSKNTGTNGKLSCKNSGATIKPWRSTCAATTYRTSLPKSNSIA